MLIVLSVVVRIEMIRNSIFHIYPNLDLLLVTKVGGLISPFNPLYPYLYYLLKLNKLFHKSELKVTPNIKLLPFLYFSSSTFIEYIAHPA